MDKFQAWVGLFGIGLLLFDRIASALGWRFGTDNAQSNLRRDVDALRRDVDRMNERGSERNGELQRIIGTLELSSVENRKDIQSLKERMDRYERPRR